MSCAGCAGENYHQTKIGASHYPIADAGEQFEFIGSDHSLREISSRSFLGKPLLVYVFSSWCAVCKADLQFIEKSLYQRLSPGIQTIGVMVSSPGESIVNIRMKLGLTFPVLEDPSGQLLKMLGSHEVPLLFLLSERGQLVPLQSAQNPPAEVVTGPIQWEHLQFLESLKRH